MEIWKYGKLERPQVIEIIRYLIGIPFAKKKPFSKLFQ